MFLQISTFVLLRAQIVNEQDTLAQIGTNYIVTFRQLQEYVYERYFDRLYHPVYKGYNFGLEQIIAKQLKVIDFFNRGLNKDSILVKSIKRTINEELAYQYFNMKYYGKYVNDSTINLAYEESKKEVKYKQILLAKKGNDLNMISDSLKRLAVYIQNMIEIGANFDSLALIFSHEFELLDAGSNVFSLNWEKSLTQNRYYVIFNTPPGEIKIMEDDRALYIVKVISIDTIQIEPLEKIKSKLIKILENRYTYICLTEFDKENENLFNKAQIKWNQRGLKQFVKWANTPGFFEKDYNKIIKKNIAQGNNFIILNSPNYKLDLKKLLYLLDEVLIIRQSGSIKENKIKDFLIEAIRADMLANKARQLGYEDILFNPYTKNTRIVDAIVKLYNQELIEKQIPKATKEALLKFYESNMDSLYYQLAKIYTYVIYESDTTKITDLKRKLAEGTPFEKLGYKIFVKRFIRDRFGKKQPDIPGEDSTFAEIAFTLAPDEVIGPLACNNPEGEKKYALIKCVKTREEKQLLYSDVKDRIKDDFIKAHREKLMAEFDKELKEKYKPVIYWDRLKIGLKSKGIEYPSEN